MGSAPIVNTTQTNITFPLGSQVLLDCPYSSLWNITDVSWQIINLTGTFLIEQPLDMNIYSGSTVQNSSLLIKSLKMEDEGRYTCSVQNKFGVGRGNEISLNIQPGLYIYIYVVYIIVGFDYWHLSSLTSIVQLYLDSQDIYNEMAALKSLH